MSQAQPVVSESKGRADTATTAPDLVSFGKTVSRPKRVTMGCVLIFCCRRPFFAHAVKFTGRGAVYHTRARESSSSCAANPLKQQPHGRHVDCSMRFASTLCPSCHSRHPRPFGARSVHLEATANPIVGGSKTPPPPSVRTSSQYTVSTRSYATLLSQIRPPACVCTLRKPAQRGRSVPFSCTVREAAVLNVALVPFAFAFSFARARVASRAVRSVSGAS